MTLHKSNALVQASALVFSLLFFFFFFFLIFLSTCPFVEPLLLQIRVVIDEEVHIVHFIYEPNGVVAPVSIGDNECTFFIENDGYFFFC